MLSLTAIRTLSLSSFLRNARLLNTPSLQPFSTRSEIKVQEEEEDVNNELMKDFEKLTNISVKSRIKKPQKPPFVKNLHVGVFDTDILAYPELEKEQLEELNKELEPVESYLNETFSQGKRLNLHSDFTENLKRLRLFGLHGSQLLNARELNVTESCRFYEVLARNTSLIAGLLHNDLLGCQVIMNKGGNELQKKYLPQLISGKCLSAFCMLEENLIDNQLKTTATLARDKKTWILNGEKMWVINGGVANLYIVLANTEHTTKLGIREKKSTLFLVEKDFGGIATEPCNSLGIEGSNISNVKFNDVSVPGDNIIGEINGGETIISSVLSEFRLSTGPACSGILRTLSRHLIDNCIHSKNKASIAETDYIQSLVSDVAQSLYSIESVTYLTAGLLDQYENQDCQVETAITKVFSTEQTCASILKVMDFIGPAAYLKDHWCNILHRDALSYYTLNETNSTLRLNITLLCLQHAGLKLQDQIRKIRNPLHYSSEVFKRMWTQRRQKADNPKLTLNLPDYVHPTAVTMAEMLEYCVLRLQFATETLLGRYGPEVVNKHIELSRLANCAIDIYVMTACIGRASRSYCIGLQSAEYEMMLAYAFCFKATERVRYLVREIYDGPYATNDDNSRKIARRVFHFKKYFPEHPLARNF